MSTSCNFHKFIASVGGGLDSSLVPLDPPLQQPSQLQLRYWIIKSEARRQLINYHVGLLIIKDSYNTN